MASKRKFDELEAPTSDKTYELKNSLDSDEEDEKDEDAYDILNEDDIEGAEDGENRMDGEARLTAFNMTEEMEEGHFDKDGHFIWNKEKQIQDSWLDSIDWQKIRKPTEEEAKKMNESKGLKGLADDSDSDEEEGNFDEIGVYKKILAFMKPKETIAKCLKRLGGTTKRISSVERWKLKKAGKLEENSSDVTTVTEMANEILTKTGNMDVYQETFEMIENKIKKKEGKSSSDDRLKEPEFDMYADDFSDKEQSKKSNLTDEELMKPPESMGPSTSRSSIKELSSESSEQRSDFDKVAWEYKLTVDATDIKGPHSSEQMLKWVEDGFFKENIWVRRVGQTEFYSSSRVDFDLYV